MDWSGVDYCDVFISCLDSHSDGTHSLQSIHCWDTDAETHFSKPNEKQTHPNLGWTEGEHIFIFGWSIPLNGLSKCSSSELLIVCLAAADWQYFCFPCVKESDIISLPSLQVTANQWPFNNVCLTSGRRMNMINTSSLWKPTSLGILKSLSAPGLNN